jgi:GDPmannose 4,6-dehydratase
MSRSALIFGASGQDGTYLSQLLLAKGYRVWGASHEGVDPPPNHRRLGIAGQVAFLAADVVDADAVERAVAAAEPDEIYYLAAQSSVARFAEDPPAGFAVSMLGLVNVLDAARRLSPRSRILHAASGDCFGPTTREAPADENSPFAPRSYYAAAKCAAHHALSAYRLNASLFACSAFLFNHESPLRPPEFAIGKLIAAARQIAAGSDGKLRLGNIGVLRDWGWAPDYVEAMWLMLQQPDPADLVIASGRTCSLQDMVAAVFRHFGLDWRDHVVLDRSEVRPNDIVSHFADPARAADKIGWRAGLAGTALIPALLREDSCRA